MRALSLSLLLSAILALILTPLVRFTRRWPRCGWPAVC
jgi:predicted PurR-regulated permease PerM